MSEINMTATEKTTRKKFAPQSPYRGKNYVAPSRGSVEAVRVCLRKLFAIVLLAVVCMAGYADEAQYQYSRDFENFFMDNCPDKRHSMAHCQCMFESLKANISLYDMEQFVMALESDYRVMGNKHHNSDSVKYGAIILTKVMPDLSLCSSRYPTANE